ncbi:protein of unknown function [Andreprevotia lacus DSM 23236]|jgi:hypothetical protein|uniref:DUF4145 domain-containing protein n=1 Tax=Andreprevotia lacus DSM 23236 TaxID=1121001 RepID=A0A1W1XK83_9NEIS|nr:DUF4145 domain-containing protein [Andreprevotia lacus]SMC24242.1 protein of unknown function [Andreprevotia lacus DSM 23236]
MSESTYTSPRGLLNAFNCPLCNAYAQQSWYSLQRYSGHLRQIFEAVCAHCKESSYWYAAGLSDEEREQARMVIPDHSVAPMPHDDLPADCTSDFLEARAVLHHSPRASAALLRLVVQKLCVHLGESGNDINKDIGKLVAKGLPTTLQQALDAVRIVGNSSVHPGEIDLNDTPEIALHLFTYVNLVVEKMIAEPKQLANFYSSLPAGKLAGVAQRDQPKPSKP